MRVASSPSSSAEAGLDLEMLRPARWFRAKPIDPGVFISVLERVLDPEAELDQSAA